MRSSSLTAASAPASPRWGWLLLSFTRREVINRYAGSFSGLAWTLLHPLAQLAIYAFVFNRIFRVSVPPDFAPARYITFMAVAWWPWIMFAEGLQQAMGSIAANAGLIRKVAFPHRLLVFAAILATAIVHGTGFLAVIAVLRLAGEPIRLSGIPIAFALLVPYLLLATGIGAFLAALQTLLRDVEHVMQVVLQLLFYAAPILYPASLVPASVRPWIELNPLGWFSERMREVLLHGGGFVVGDLWTSLVCFAVFVAGLAFFERLSPHFEDFL